MKTGKITIYAENKGDATQYEIVKQLQKIDIDVWAVIPIKED